MIERVCELVMSLIGTRGKALAADERGSASVEFVMVAPVLLAFVFSMFEAGWLMTKSMMLERGLDLTVRELRLGNTANVTHDDFKKSICDKISIARNCEDNMVLEVVAVASAASIPQTAVCRDRTSTAAPATTFTPGVDTQITFIRACLIVDPIMPGMGLGLHLPRTKAVASRW